MTTRPSTTPCRDVLVRPRAGVIALFLAVTVASLVLAVAPAALAKVDRHHAGQYKRLIDNVVQGRDRLVEGYNEDTRAYERLYGEIDAALATDDQGRLDRAKGEAGNAARMYDTVGWKMYIGLRRQSDLLYPTARKWFSTGRDRARLKEACRDWVTGVRLIQEAHAALADALESLSNAALAQAADFADQANGSSSSAELMQDEGEKALRALQR